MKKTLIVIVLAIVMAGCATIEGTDGRKYSGFDLTDWEELHVDMSAESETAQQMLGSFGEAGTYAH